MTRLTDIALVVFLASLALNWPDLPLGIRFPDLIFLPLALLTVAAFRRTRCSPQWLDLLVLLYLLGSLPSFLVTGDLRESATELIRHAYVVAIYAVVARLVASSRAPLAGTGLAIGGVALSLIGLTFAGIYMVHPVAMPAMGEVMRLPYVGGVLRLRALTMAPSMLGSLLAATVPFALIRALQSNAAKSRRRWALAVAAICAAMLLTVSHTIAGFAVACLIVLWPELRPRAAVQWLAIAAAAVVVCGFNFTLAASIDSVSSTSARAPDAVTYPYGMETRELELGGVRVRYQVMSYLRTKQVALDAFLSRPLTGIGLDQFHRASEAAYQRGLLTAGYRAIDPHSALLGCLAETGLAGGTTLLVLWGGFVVAGVRLSRVDGPYGWLARAATAAFIGLLINGINVDIMNFRFVWAELGILRGLAQLYEV